MPVKRYLDVSADSLRGSIVRGGLKERVVGQEEGINATMDILERYWSTLLPPRRPIGSLLFLGPTGSGKTRLVEATAACVLGDEKSLIKIDCAEFQHSHEIAKLLGSPPGYLGHRETHALLKQENLDRLHTQTEKLTLILFDEIEKASDALWHLMLGILDKAVLTLGDNTKTNFERCIIFMTSNAGSEEMSFAVGNRMGFVEEGISVDEAELKRIGIEAAKRKFTPEFINRLDRMVSFKTLTKEQIYSVVDIEVGRFNQEVEHSPSVPMFFVRLEPKAKAALIEEGYDPKRNGRGIRNVIERRVIIPIGRALSARKIMANDVIMVGVENGDYTFGVEGV